VRRVALALGAICLLCFFRSSLTLGRHLPLNFNEGWNAYHTADVAAVRPLYPDPAGLFFNNYPPLSFLLIAPIGRALGDQLLAGRVIAMASFAAWIALLAVAARRLRCSWTNALFGAVVLAIHMFVFSDFYVGVNDPQMLGHAVQALGLVVVLADTRSTGRLLAAAALFSAGVLIKTNLIALPLAVAIWLLATDRSSAWRLIAFGAASGILGAATCLAVFGPEFIAQVLSPRGLVPAKAAMMAWQWVARMALPLGVIVWLATRGHRDRYVGFALA
jgi:hypothetical protein